MHVHRSVGRRSSSTENPKEEEVDTILQVSMSETWITPYQLESKLSPKWTRPYQAVEVPGNGAHMLETLEGGPSPRAWNVTNLKFYCC